MCSTLAAASVLLVAGCHRPDAGPARVKALYDQQTGRLQQIAYDSTNRGRPDMWAYMDGATLRRLEVDTDGDGQVDRWEVYAAERRIEKVGTSRAHNGKADAWYFPDAEGRIARGEYVNAKGRITRTAFYESGRLVRAEEDRNGDGRVDAWQTYRDGRLTSIAFDSDGSGRPGERINYGDDGTPVAAGAPVSVKATTPPPAATKR